MLLLGVRHVSKLPRPIASLIISCTCMASATHRYTQWCVYLLTSESVESQRLCACVESIVTLRQLSLLLLCIQFLALVLLQYKLMTSDGCIGSTRRDVCASVQNGAMLAGLHGALLLWQSSLTNFLANARDQHDVPVHVCCVGCKMCGLQLFVCAPPCGFTVS